MAGVCATAVGKNRPRYRFSLFFDGTGNNRYNIDSFKATGVAHGDSYKAEYSNVVKMFDYLHTTNHPGFEAHQKIYIEGIGTARGAGDSDLGQGLGTSSFGVRARVDDTISLIADRLNQATQSKRQSLPAGQKLEVEVSFDVVGFSRGAAAARHFVHRMLVEGPCGSLLDGRLDEFRKAHPELGYNITIVFAEVIFAGLFDTVSHEGVSQSNDVRALGLDSIKLARRVVHLTAADEYRENFALTTVQSVPAKARMEISLPGAHSDIGGGYKVIETEDDIVVMQNPAVIHGIAPPEPMDEDARWLTSQGWYKTHELNKELRTIKANRVAIPNIYSRIPLRIMVHQATKADLEFENIAAREPLDSALEALYAKMGPDGGGDWEDEPVLIKIWTLRHTYLHFSSKYEGTLNVHAPRLVVTTDDKNVRHWHREREVFRG